MFALGFLIGFIILAADAKSLLSSYCRHSVAELHKYCCYCGDFFGRAKLAGYCICKRRNGYACFAWIHNITRVYYMRVVSRRLKYERFI